MRYMIWCPVLVMSLCLLPLCLSTQTVPFYFGADLSYVNEMEDCGVVYLEEGQEKDPYEIFSSHGTNLVRLRLWHTPGWQDTLNAGMRYSDLADVQKSIARAKALDMHVLLDFHLSDTWADPSKQYVPAAWAEVVDDLPILKDSLYNYIYQTLASLHQKHLLPEMIQLGNEVNRGILQSVSANDAGWKLDWIKNGTLFNTAIKAVRDFEKQFNQEVQVVLHVADPKESSWLLEGFFNHGVTDFDIIGLSYYWAWHQPTTIEETGQVIANLQLTYPDKQVMIVETGYAWTLAQNDQANNIINSLHPDYSPASPLNQKDWLIDLAKEIIKQGGIGMIYWEPAWVSSSCYTPWGQGSHQEHATFFDFEENLISEGGIGWMQFPYFQATRVDQNEYHKPEFAIQLDSQSQQLVIQSTATYKGQPLELLLVDNQGRLLTRQQQLHPGNRNNWEVKIPSLHAGVYWAVLFIGNRFLGKQPLVITN